MIVERAGLRIDLDFADGGAVGKHRLVHLVVGDDGDAVLERVGQLMPRGFAGEFEEIEGAVGVARDETAVIERNMSPPPCP